MKLNPDTKTKAKVVKALIVAKEELSRAVKYCQDKNVCGYSASGLSLFVKDARTIKQLDKPTSPTKSKRSDCKVLSNMEEQALVQFLKNKSHFMQGATRAEATKFVHDILRVREHLIKQCKRRWHISWFQTMGKSSWLRESWANHFGNILKMIIFL